MPCVELFEEQSVDYRESVLPSNITNRVSVEAGSTLGWYKYVGLNGFAIGVDSFGLSAKANDVYNHFGITTENIVNTTIDVINSNN